MATVSLQGLWLNDYDDPSDYIVLDWGTALQRNRIVPGVQVVTASGRLLRRVSAGVSRQWSASASRCTPDQMDWIEAHAGVDVWVRDWLGRRILGFYLQTPTDQHLYDVNGDVSLTFDEVTPGVV